MPLGGAAAAEAGAEVVARRLSGGRNFMAKSKSPKKVPEIPVIGDVDDWESDVIHALLDIEPGGPCTFYIDSAGGSVYGALAVLTLMRHRKHEGTAIVLGECSSAALLLFAACKRRYVTPYSTLLFHRMRWQSEKRVAAEEAFLWARHFEEMEKDLDNLQAELFGAAEEQIRTWTRGSYYVTGPQIVAAGLAEMLPV
jgi:ATP-dependent protease ClpP protease subunit